MLKKQSLLIWLTISLLSFKNYGQGTGNSPYSAIGIGEINQMGFANSYALGGSGVSFSNGFSINNINPALLAKNHYTVYEVGVLGSVKTIENANQSQKTAGANLNYLAISFPIRPKWSSSLSYQPYTSINSEARISSPITASSTDTVQYTYKSTGGISKLAWANGFNLGKSLYLGFEARYLFGSATHDTTTYLQLYDGQNYYLKHSDNSSYKGLGFKVGMAYQQKISKNWQINVGAAYDFQSTLKGTGLRSFSTLINGANGPTLSKTPDTLSIYRGQVTLPDSYTVGISLESTFKWYFSADYTVQKWSKFRNSSGNADVNYTDSQIMSFGIEYLPKFNSTKYFDNASYRIGFQSAKTPYIVSGTQIMDNHVSMGMSLPLGKRSLNFSNITLIAGSRGTTTNGLIKENYFKFVFGITINDIWFQKVRID